MSTVFTFRPAARENVGLWINLIGGTGSGKTFSGFRLASGIAGDKPFAVIDTENRRALHYADQFRFDHAELRPPFRPAAYADAVTAADAAGYPVIMIDSGSHVWAGDGGVLDWHDANIAERIKQARKNNDSRSDWQLEQAFNMAAWIDPKMAHKQMVQKLLQVKAHIILCLRAEEKIEMVKDKGGKLVIQAKQSLTGKDGWIPVCDKNLPFEATASFLLLASAPGIPHPIKLQEQHKALFPLDKPITEESGRKLAQWAAGGKTPESAPPQTAGPATASANSPSPGSASGADPSDVYDEESITDEQEGIVLARLKEHGVALEAVLAFGGWDNLRRDMPKRLFNNVCNWIADKGGIRTKRKATARAEG